MTVRMVGRVVREAILHCAAVPTGWANGKTPEQVVSIIDGWHRERGFAGIGYHYVVMPSGLVQPGRPVDQPGAHTVGRNGDTIGVLLLESRRVDAIRDFAAYFTEAQRLAVMGIMRRHGLDRVSGHNDHAKKLCPGFRVEPGFFSPAVAGAAERG